MALGDTIGVAGRGADDAAGGCAGGVAGWVSVVLPVGGTGGSNQLTVDASGHPVRARVGAYD